MFSGAIFVIFGKNFCKSYFFPKSKKNDIGKLIKCYLAFQEDFTTKRDGGIFLPDCPLPKSNSAEKLQNQGFTKKKYTY